MEKLLKLRVCGEVLWVARSTLLESNSPVLSRMASGEMEPGLLTEDGCIFVEEDALVFKNILHVIRSGSVPSPPLYGVSKSTLLRRMLYWGLAQTQEEDVKRAEAEDEKHEYPLQDKTVWALESAIHSLVCSTHKTISANVSTRERRISAHMAWHTEKKPDFDMEVLQRFAVIISDKPVVVKGLGQKKAVIPLALGGELLEMNIAESTRVVERMTQHAVKQVYHPMKWPFKVLCDFLKPNGYNVRFAYRVGSEDFRKLCLRRWGMPPMPSMS